MLKTKLYLVCLLVLLASGCFPPTSQYREPSASENSVLVYLQPVPQEAAKFRFIVDWIAAVRDDGSKIPLALAMTELQGQIEVLPATFERQNYGIALPAGSALREPINRVLLEKIAQPAWQDVLYRYLGQ